MKNHTFKQVTPLTSKQLTAILERAKETCTKEQVETLKTKLQNCVFEYRDKYIKDEDITIIICDGYIPGKTERDNEYIFTKVSGFYYGEPDMLSTQYFCENAIAIYE
jgi:hypothetical protein